MVIRSTGYDIYAPVHQSLAERLRIGNDIFPILFKTWIERLLEANRLRRDHVHERAALDARENGFIQFIFGREFLAGQDHTASWAAQCLMGRRRRHMRVRDRALVDTSSDQAGNMSHIHHKKGPHFICNLTKSLKINFPAVRARTSNDHFRLAFFGDTFYLIIIDKSLIIYAVWHDMVIRSRNIRRTSM